jgi:hypothetical protein
VDATWPDGLGTPALVEGRCRDLLTTSEGEEVLAEDSLHVVLGLDRSLLEIRATPERPGLSALAGARGGARLRARIAEAVPDEQRAGSPLFLLLDDLAGVSLVGPFAWTQWPELLPPRAVETAKGGERRMEGICAGFRPGSSGLDPNGSPRFNHDLRVVPPLVRDDDPMGWHEMPEQREVAMRRARRIDVTVDGQLHVAAMFQDSVTRPTGDRVAVHEYALTATASSAGVLTSVLADPRVLPYAECPLAAPNVDRLVGTPLVDLREDVLERLKGVVGCTHLNDALRALAEVPRLAAALSR